MAKRLIDLLRSIVPLPAEKKVILAELAVFLEDADIREITLLAKQKKTELTTGMFEVSPQVMAERSFPVISPMTKEQDIVDYISRLNKAVKDRVQKRAFSEFSRNAPDMIQKFIAMNIVGMDEVKKAASVQLFANYAEPVHILLLGDPGTGKTDILRSVSSLSPISSFGLGSGTSGVGLTVTVKGNEVLKGLLPMADKGLCAIDELNLMQERDRASLYNAMEKGFITYDKGGKHYKFDSRIKVIATANPVGDRFAGWTIETLKKQMPFDSALLTRFHLVFLIRKPDIQQFVEISKKIIRSEKKKALTGDESFIRDYVEYAQDIKVDIPVEFERGIIDFIAEIKENENRYLIEISPRLVVGFLRLAKASARMRLATKVTQDDIDLVKEIVTRGLRIEK